MQLLFVHPNFPGQFGPLLSRLTTRPDLDCVFFSTNATGMRDGVRCIPFTPRGGARQTTHFCSRTFENAVWSAHAVYEACEKAQLNPDVVIGHSGFGTTAFLQELYDCPIINLFEYYYHTRDSDMDFRPDFPSPPIAKLRAHARNAMILMDLQACAAGYAPTAWQKSLFPPEYQSKIEVMHDGIDTEFWQRRPVPRRIGNEIIPDDVRIVTYVARGLESMRGFDIFVRVANRIAKEMSNVLFAVVGSDRVCYGNDLSHIKTKTFREHVIQTEQPDLSRFRFLETIPKTQLVDILSLSDLHIYLTVPFVLSWSLLNAMACECTVLASDVAPVREVIEHERTGLLRDFFDVEGLTDQALNVLRDPMQYRDLGQAGRAVMEQEYSLEKIVSQFLALLEGAKVTSPIVSL
ncbi:MAG TPA: glycosyltransferase [Nitrospira sp.]|nr:glycosyltransferase [Nitrospira sp.]